MLSSCHHLLCSCGLDQEAGATEGDFQCSTGAAPSVQHWCPSSAALVILHFDLISADGLLPVTMAAFAVVFVFPVACDLHLVTAGKFECVSEQWYVCCTRQPRFAAMVAWWTKYIVGLCVGCGQLDFNSHVHEISAHVVEISPFSVVLRVASGSPLGF